MSIRLVGQTEKLKVNIVGAEKHETGLREIVSVDEYGVYFINSRGNEVFIPHARISKIAYDVGTKKKKSSKKDKKKGKKGKKSKKS